MLPARKKPWFSQLFGWHVRWRLRRHFASVRILGLEQMRATAATSPLLLAVNHSAWWDSLVLFDLCSRVLALDAYALMDEDNLRALPFLGWIGGFGVKRGDKEDGVRALAYARERLVRPGQAVLMFPQGREEAQSKRPLGFKPGLARLAEGVPVKPIALRYEHGSEEHPVLLIHCGALVPAGETSAAYEAALVAVMDTTEEAWVSGAWRQWPVLLHGRGTRFRGRH